MKIYQLLLASVTITQIIFSAEYENRWESTYIETPQPVLCLAHSNDLVVAAALERQILLLDQETGAVRQTLTSPNAKGLLRSIAFNPINGTLVVRCPWKDGNISMWCKDGDGIYHEFPSTIKLRNAEFAPIKFSRDGNILASPDDRSLVLRDATTHQILGALRHDSIHDEIFGDRYPDIYSFDFSFDSYYVATHSTGRKIHVWDRRTLQRARTFGVTYTEDIAFEPEGRLAITSRGRIGLLGMDGSLEILPTEVPSVIEAMQFTPNRECVVYYLGEPYRVCVLDERSAIVATLNNPEDRLVSKFSSNTDASHIAIGGNGITFWNRSKK